MVPAPCWWCCCNCNNELEEPGEADILVVAVIVVSGDDEDGIDRAVGEQDRGGRTRSAASASVLLVVVDVGVDAKGSS
jgi:hypothetical protein